MVWIAVGIVAIVLIEFLLRLPIILGAVKIFEQSPGFGVEPAAPHDDGELVQFASTAGLTLVGSVCKPPGEIRGVFIYCPETGGNHWMSLSYTVALRNAGYAIVAVDFRNQGESQFMEGYEAFHWPTEYEVSDALAALEFVRSRDDLSGLPFGFFGVSRGGTIALAAAARSEAVCVICDGAFIINKLMHFFARRWAELYVPRRWLQYIPDWHIGTTLWFARGISQLKRKVRYVTLTSDLRKLRGRGVMLIAGKRDSYVKPKMTAEIARRTGGTAEVWIAPKAKHNMARKMNTEEYDHRIVEFAEQHMVEKVAVN